MSEEPRATKITQILQREDGSEVKIVATAMFGEGLHRSVDVYVHKRQSEKHEWILLSDRPHPDWRAMSVDDYIKGGRSEMLQTVSIGELFRAMDLIGKPMSQFRTPEENLLAAAPAEDEPRHDAPHG